MNDDYFQWILAEITFVKIELLTLLGAKVKPARKAMGLPVKENSILYSSLLQISCHA